MMVLTGAEFVDGFRVLLSVFSYSPLTDHRAQAQHEDCFA